MINRRAMSIALVALSVSGCARLAGNLRRDLDDSGSFYPPPTIGGAWPETGYLAEPSFDPEQTVGHSSRAPASVGADGDAGSAWNDRGESMQRDFYREPASAAQATEGPAAPPSFSSNPIAPPPEKPLYKYGNRASRADFVDESPNEGSLWASDGQTNYYFTKNKVRAVGDIVSIETQPTLYKDVIAEIKRTLNPDEQALELAEAQERIRQAALTPVDPEAAKRAGATPTPAPATPAAPAAPGAENSDQVATGAAAPARNPAEAGKPGEPPVRAATAADVDITKNIDIGKNDPILAEIIERYPNGNYRVRGNKKFTYRGSKRTLVVTAIVKPSDFEENDTIKSDKLYEYKIESYR